MKLRLPPRRKPDAAPLRAYAPRRLMFKARAGGGSVSIYCSRCQETLEGKYPWVDVATVTEACRDHEIASHSVVVSAASFAAGGVITFPDPEYLRARVEGRLTATELDAPPFVSRRVAYEWLGEDERGVIVRDPVALADWLGPERADRELAPA